MKTIAVVGATGAMGRSVVRALVDHPSQEFQVRALTRNPTGKRANELKGYSDKISTIQADTNDQKSLEAAFRGVHGVFCNTDYWNAGSRVREIVQSINVATACLNESVEHLVYSSLEYVSEISKSALTLPYFDSKAEASEYILAMLPKASILVSAPYFENFLGYALPEKRQRSDGDFEFVFKDPMADKPYTMVALDDIGQFAAYAFAEFDSVKGKKILVASDSPTMMEVADTFSKVTGLRAVYEPMTLKEFRETHKGTVNDIQDSPDGEFVGNMFEFIRVYGINRDYDFIKSINPKVMNFEAWLRHTKWKGEPVAVQNYFVSKTSSEKAPSQRPDCSHS